MVKVFNFEKFKQEKENAEIREEEDKKVIERLEQREREKVSVNIKINSISGANFLKLKSFLKELGDVDYEVKDLNLIEGGD
ncbi:MAG: hypothetical protein AAB772_02890 [Patescibacteria group bacterium]